jgi:hypothetical protein
MAEITGNSSSELRLALKNGRIFTPFVEDVDVSDGQKEVVTSPLWSNSRATLYAIYTSSYQNSNQKRYYYEIYNTSSNLVIAEPQFSVAYGDSVGSGSDRGTGNIDDYPTKAVYKQYKQLLLDSGENAFTFKNSETSEYVYIINVNRARYKDKVDTSNWQLSIGKLSATTSASIATSADVITLIDDSGASSTEYTVGGGRVYNVVSGSIANGTYTPDTTPWGLFYPDQGVIVLNGKALDASASFYTNRSPSTASINQNNAFRLFTSISGAMSFNTSSYSFEGRTSEVVSSTYYFVRLYNGEYNYSTNPTFLTGSLGVVKYARMVTDPSVYLTTIGLYDDSTNLLAVAKLSKPIEKSFEKEVVIKVKLDF